jgi:hypothetical protein
MKNNRNLSLPVLLEIFCSVFQVILRQTETRDLSELIDVLSPMPPLTVCRTPSAPYSHLHLAGNLVTLKTGGQVISRYLHPSDRYVPGSNINCAVVRTDDYVFKAQGLNLRPVIISSGLRSFQILSLWLLKCGGVIYPNLSMLNPCIIINHTSVPAGALNS